ncbi:MAG: hypothetical protein OXL34_08605 [Gemmatimonadota bacterium]|nr:hypothetical protein [Gemmatimonadota bacterium]
MTQMEEALERLPDELARKVMRQGILLGQALLLRDQAARRFNKRTAAWLCYLVDLSGRDSIDRVAAALLECGTEAEFLERVQTENGEPPKTDGAQDLEPDGALGGTSRKMITGRILWRFPPRKVQRKAETMAEVVDQFQQGLDELFEQGVEHGFRKGQVHVLHRLASRKFGEEMARQLCKLLDGQRCRVDIDMVADALTECAANDEFLERVRKG